MGSATVGVAPPSGARVVRLSAERHAWREIQISDSTTARRVFINIHLFEYLEMNNYGYAYNKIYGQISRTFNSFVPFFFIAAINLACETHK